MSSCSAGGLGGGGEGRGGGGEGRGGGGVGGGGNGGGDVGGGGEGGGEGGGGEGGGEGGGGDGGGDGAKLAVMVTFWFPVQCAPTLHAMKSWPASAVVTTASYKLSYAVPEPPPWPVPASSVAPVKSQALYAASDAI